MFLLYWHQIKDMDMRISSAASYGFLKNSPSFNAEVIVLPSSPIDQQPAEDKLIMERKAEEMGALLQKRFPDINDNLQIFLQPSGRRQFENTHDMFIIRKLKEMVGYADDSKGIYWNKLRAFFGYKDADRACRDILKRNEKPPEYFYVKLQPETIEKIKNKDSEMMKKLERKAEHESEYCIKEDIDKNIGIEFADDVEEIIKSGLDFGLTEWEKPRPKPDKTDKRFYIA